jgi:hypothetical protein
VSERRFDATVIATLLLLSGAGSLWLGQDVSGDLRNYHFYNGYELLTGRLDRDIAGASLGSYFNPVMDAVHYWGMTRLPARLFGFLLGAIHGLNPALVYLVARRLAANGARLPAVAAAALAAIGPTAVLVLGTASGDSLAALPALAAFWLVLRAVEAGSPPRLRILFLGGVLGGAAVAFKLTMGPYAAALALGLLVAAPGAASLVAFFLGLAAGYLAAGGYWCWQLWIHFGNPLFPFANQIFHSPFMSSTWLNDPNWRPHTLADYLRPPLDMLLGRTERIREFPFRDPRFFLIGALGLAYVLRQVTARGRRATRLYPGERLLLAYLAAGYTLWLLIFYYHRYMLPLELLAPVAVYVLLRALLPKGLTPRLTPIFATIVLAIALATGFAPRAWGRSPLWRDGWFEVRVPRIGTMPNTAVLIDIPGNSFVLPYFPVDARFFNLHHMGSPRFDEEIARAVAQHVGPLLYTPPIGERRLALFGLRDAGHCEPLKTSHGTFGLCLAERSVSAGRN